MTRQSQEKSLRDGNGRTARLARWLQQSPSAAQVDSLVLEIKQDGEWQRLQIWPRDEVSQALASVIDSTVTELANELGAYITARAAWFNLERQAYWTEHALRVQPEDLDVTQAFSGDAQSIAIQNQRHQERIVGVHIGGFNSAIHAMRETNADLRSMKDQVNAENLTLREQLYTAQSDVLRLEAELAKVQQMLDDALVIIEKAPEPGNDNGQSDQSKQVIQMITAAVGQHMAQVNNGKAS
jgi:hypothetical protein